MKLLYIRPLIAATLFVSIAIVSPAGSAVDPALASSLLFFLIPTILVELVLGASGFGVRRLLKATPTAGALVALTIGLLATVIVVYFGVWVFIAAPTFSVGIPAYMQSMVYTTWGVRLFGLLLVVAVTALGSTLSDLSLD